MSLWSSKKAPSDCKAQCPDCGVILSRLADLNRHRKTKHPDGTETKFSCPWSGCAYKTTQKGNLKSHVDARHSDGPKYPCPECGRRFTDAAARIRHRKKMHGYVPYHTKEYIARQALSRKERLVEGTIKAVSDGGRRQQADFAAPAERLGTLDERLGGSSSIPNLPSAVPTFPSTVPTFPSTVPTFPSTVPNFPSTIPNLSSTVLPQATKRPEVAYYNKVWKMPENVTHSYSPQPHDVPLILPFETWPGYGTSNAIQNFPSAAQSPPSQALTPSDCTIDYYPGLHDPQPYTMSSPEQQFGESLTGAGDHAMPPYNENELWNWPLQNWLLQ